MGPQGGSRRLGEGFTDRKTDPELVQALVLASPVAWRELKDKCLEGCLMSLPDSDKMAHAFSRYPKATLAIFTANGENHNARDVREVVPQLFEAAEDAGRKLRVAIIGQINPCSNMGTVAHVRNVDEVLDSEPHLKKPEPEPETAEEEDQSAGFA